MVIPQLTTPPELRLFGRAGVETGQRRRGSSRDWAALARELKRPGVTMMILWEDYREINQGGHGQQPVLRSASRVRATRLEHGDAPTPRCRRKAGKRWSTRASG